MAEPVEKRMVQLGDVADFINGAAFKPEDWGSTGARIIRIQNLNDPSKPYNRTERVVDPKLHVQRGDLLVSWSASLGVFVWDQEDTALLNQHIFRVVPNETQVEKDYLRHMLFDALESMKRHLHGATMMHVNRKEFLSTRIPLPPLDEQRRIAAILDKADELRTKRRQALAHLDALTQSIFHSMFGDPVHGDGQTALSELLTSIESGKSPVCEDRPALPHEWGVLKLSAVTRQVFDDSQHKALVVAGPDHRHEVRPGDVLFTRKNTPELVAAVALVRSTRPKLLLPDLIFRLRIADQAVLAPAYLHAVLSNPRQRSVVQGLAGGAAASMSNISKSKLMTVRIPVPALELQQTFATRVAAVERLKESHRKHLAQLGALFASLQHRAFKGEL